MLKFLSKVVVEYCPLDPRKAAAVELLAQCNGRKAKDSNPACSVELRRLPSPPAAEEPKKPQLPPPRVLVTYLNGAEEAFVAADGATAQGIREQILARGRLIETEQMFRDGGEKWPVVIPEEELAMSYPGIKVRPFPYSVLSFLSSNTLNACLVNCVDLLDQIVRSLLVSVTFFFVLLYVYGIVVSILALFGFMFAKNHILVGFVLYLLETIPRAAQYS